MRFKTKKQRDEFAINPVGKARIIVDTMTDCSHTRIKLLEILTHYLTGEEITEFYNRLITNNNQLTLNL